MSRIPRDMSVDAKRSLISVAQDGTKTGLITVEGAWTSLPSPTP
mgnify:CR=1 FL=1